jgi:hypothetical protein
MAAPLPNSIIVFQGLSNVLKFVIASGMPIYNLLYCNNIYKSGPLLYYRSHPYCILFVHTCILPACPAINKYAHKKGTVAGAFDFIGILPGEGWIRRPSSGHTA